jgi:hypothetical protein
MLNDNAKDVVRGLIQEAIVNEEAFSAYEITVLARQKLGSHEKHYELKEIVHNEFKNGNMGEYLRTLHDFNGVEAWVYHPQDVDPHTREEIVIDEYHWCGTPMPTNIGTKVMHKIPNTPSGALKRLTKEVDLDADVFYVPVEYVRSIGASPGDKVEICQNGDTVSILPINLNKYNPNDIENKLTVDQRGNVRIHTDLLYTIGVRSSVNLNTDGTAISLYK